MTDCEAEMAPSCVLTVFDMAILTRWRCFVLMVTKVDGGFMWEYPSPMLKLGNPGSMLGLLVPYIPIYDSASMSGLAISHVSMDKGGSWEGDIAS